MEIDSDLLSDGEVSTDPESLDLAKEALLVPRLRISSGNLAVLLDSPNPGDGLQGLLDYVETRMRELGIDELPDRSVLEKKISEKLEPGSPIHGLVLAEGVAPIQGENGWIEWEEDFFMTGFKIDGETKRMNFRERNENLTVKSGQVLARVFPRSSGIPGIDIFGEVVSCEKTADLTVSIGSNIEVKEGEGCTIFSSTIDGRIRWANDTLAVDEVYVIHGDVGLESGNVHYSGSVIVEGNVRAGVTIEAGGDIVISGLIEPSNIKSKGSLIVSGGIIGNEDHRIELAGGLHARYLSLVDVSSYGDIEVTRDISESKIRTLGQVIIPQGRIVGGNITAHRGIQVGQAGSMGEIPTTLISGTDYLLPDKLAKPEERIKYVSTEYERIKRITDKFRQGEKVTAESEFEKLMKQQESLAKELSTLHATMREIKKISRNQAVRKIHVHKKTFPGVKFKFGKTEFGTNEVTIGAHVWTKDDLQKTENPTPRKPFQNRA